MIEIRCPRCGHRISFWRSVVSPYCDSVCRDDARRLRKEKEQAHGRHRQAAEALQGGAGLPGADTGNTGAEQTGAGATRYPASYAAYVAREAATGGTGAGVAVAGKPPLGQALTAAPPGMGITCLVCGRPAAASPATGLCSACAGGVIGHIQQAVASLGQVCSNCGARYTTTDAACPGCTAKMMQQMQALMARAPVTAGAVTQSPRTPEPLPRADMQVVDLIGWRIWRVMGGYLGSITAGAIWLPGEPMEAAAVADYGVAQNGIHVFKTMAGAILEAAQYAAQRDTGYAIGSVLLWGDVVEHERGYRAERAKILSIDDLMWQGKPPWHEETKRALAFLRERYGLVPRGTDGPEGGAP